jgi:hypothetical protein
MVLKRYWARSKHDVYTIVMKTVNHNKEAEGHIKGEGFEGVIIRPIEPGRCKVTFALVLDAHCSKFLNPWLNRQRVSSFSGFREFVLQQICENQADEEEQITDMEEAKQDLGQSEPLPALRSDLILYGDGVSVSLEIRNPGYVRNKSGGIKCANKQELDSQKGIVLELLAKAGKQLMEGKNVVGISLPVRIFEARSTLERMVDWWCTAPVYLANACLAVRST